MRRILFSLAVCITSMCMTAQTTKVVTGAVVDKNGNPLPNALVEATGGAESVTTEADGTFRIEVPIWRKSLTARYAGFQDRKKSLKYYTTDVLFEMSSRKSWWFVNAVYSYSIALGGERKYIGYNMDYGDLCYSNIGLMGGYLGKWGGYVKVMFATCEDGGGIPSATVGVIKQVAKPAYIYLGAGYSPAYHSWVYYDNNDNYVYYGNQKNDGSIFDVGAIFKIKDFDINVGYSIAPDERITHSIQASVGYCF